MLKHLFILATVVLASCGNSEKPNTTADAQSTQATSAKKEDKVNAALNFINAYHANIEKMSSAKDMVNWVNANNLASKSFKAELSRLVDEAYKADPELGLDADPILDAQDYPNTGFELASIDEQTNYVSVKGKDMPEFKLNLKIIEENGTCLVDGCGIVNIPADKRAKR